MDVDNICPFTPRAARSTASGDRVLYRFAIVSDPHVALPETIWQNPRRFHLVEVSIPALEQIFDHLAHLNLDFLLIPGDLTQHGEPDNHRWLARRLAQLPYPTYVIPGNHDFPAVSERTRTTQAQFVRFYRAFGYDQGHRPYYCRAIAPGLRLIGLNSNQLSADGTAIDGYIDEEQMAWLDRTLAALPPDELAIVMVHHNLLEHLPDQGNHVLGKRYILENSAQLRQKLQAAGIQLVFSGHLHVQDIAEADGLYDLTTGSLVSYPHPYRTLALREDAAGRLWLDVQSHRIATTPDWPDLPTQSRDWMGDRSEPFMRKLLEHSPLDLTAAEIDAYVPHLRHFWADVAEGDRAIDYPELPPAVRAYCRSFGAIAPNGTPHRRDNHTSLPLRRPNPWAIAPAPPQSPTTRRERIDIRTKIVKESVGLS